MIIFLNFIFPKTLISKSSLSTLISSPSKTLIFSSTLSRKISSPPSPLFPYYFPNINKGIRAGCAIFNATKGAFENKDF